MIRIVETKTTVSKIARACCAVALFIVATCPATFRAVASGQATGNTASASSQQAEVQRAQIDPPEAGQETFPHASEAAQALFTAVQNNDRPALLKLFGPDSSDLTSSGDEEMDKENRVEFVQKYQQMHRLLTEPNGLTTLFIGAENWPTPIPLVRSDGKWYFDTEDGKDEILFRRVGEDEVTVIHVCTELVDAEKEYFAKPHDGESAQQYAQKILSDTGKHNGLYWVVASGAPESPLGPMIATAEADDSTQTAGRDLQPFYGYYFRVLKAQGPSAPGGVKSYIVDGKMTGGFAFVAYPAEYKSSGVMTFLVGPDGIVYQKDLGEKTSEIAKSLKQYDRDETWTKAE
jgi:hypothetical protein